MLFVMKELANYILTISSLGQGLHEYEFEINDEFFTHFESSTVKKGNINLKVYLSKQSSFMELTFVFEGHIETDCDRCLSNFNLPINRTYTLLVKYSGDDEVNNDEMDIIYISKKENELDISKFVYEFILLAIPMSKNHEMAGEQCDEGFTEFLHHEEEEKKEAQTKSIWDALKNFNKN